MENSTTETRLRGWGGRTRTRESVRSEVRPRCRLNFGESAENAPQRLFAFELRGEEYAAAARSCQTRSITAVLFNLPG